MRTFGFDRQSRTKMARVLGIAGIAAAALAMTPSPAQALPFPPSPRDIHNRVVHDVRRLLEVPRTIHRAHVNSFRSFSRGTSYYAPHRHHHAVYHFPVYAGSRVVYRPYYYCNDALFIGGGVPVPRIVVSAGPGPYYYAPGPYPPPPAPPSRCDHRYARSYDDRHDRYDDHGRHGHDRHDNHGHDRYDDDDR
jgi:hypothetical protein